MSAVTKPFDPRDHGIYRRFTDAAGYLHTTAWNRAAESGDLVGDCRRCGGHLLASPTHQNGNMTWYGARCTYPQCGYEIASPNAQALKRSSRHSEMPEGFWIQRTNRDRR